MYLIPFYSVFIAEGKISGDNSGGQFLVVYHFSYRYLCSPQMMTSSSGVNKMGIEVTTTHWKFKIFCTLQTS
jgi:hypothetical protein